MGEKPVRVEEVSGLCLWPRRDWRQGSLRMATVQTAATDGSAGRVAWGLAGQGEAGLSRAEGQAQPWAFS